jgi:hypothetical protein
LFENEHYKFLSIIRIIIENITYSRINQKFNQQPGTSNQQLKVLKQSFAPMNTKALIFFGLSLISIIIALIIFFRGLDIKALLFLIFGVAAVLLFNQGLAELKRKKE